MSYSRFKKLKVVTQTFGLSAERERLFTQTTNVEASAWLLETLSISELLPLTNEKSKAERVISPILTEIARFYATKISFFSGENLAVNDDNNDESDKFQTHFLFSLQPLKLYVEAPIFSVIETKNNDTDGIAQCATQLYNAKLFNETENKNIPILYGCATDGVKWHFIRFENNTFYVDTKIYTDLKEILGVWHHIIKSYL